MQISTTNDERGESGLIDWNYWTNAQDGEQSKTAHIASVKVSGSRSQVVLEYKFYPSPGEPHELKRSTATLYQTSGGCWLVEDLQNGEKSVTSLLRSKNAGYRQR